MIRKLLFYCVFVISSFVCYGQKIELVPEGIISTETKKDYVLVEFNGQTSQDLYQNTLIYLNQKFTKPNKVIKFNVENKIIKFNDKIRLEEITTNYRLKDSFRRSISVDVTISFKDNLVKYEVGNFDLGIMVLSKKEIFKIPIWEKDSKEINLPEEKKNIERFLNNTLEDYITFMLNNNDEW